MNRMTQNLCSLIFDHKFKRRLRHIFTEHVKRDR